MVFMLHGTSHEVPPATQHRYVGWQSVSNKHGFILVKPLRPITRSLGNGTGTPTPWTQLFNLRGRFRFSAQPDRHPDGALQREPKPGLRRRFLLGRADGAPGWRGDFGSGGGHCDWIGHDCRSGVYTADYFARRGAWAGLRSGAGGTLDRTIPPCNNGITKYSGRKFHLATVDQSFNYWTRQNACTVFQNRDPLCETDCPTRSRPATTPRDVRATPKSNIFGRRTSAHLDRAAERRSLALLCVAPEATASAEGAPSAALSSVKTPAVATQMVELDLNSRDAPRAKNYER